MLVVGLTGGIATGKSSVSGLIKAHNIPVIDADILARDVVQPGKSAHSQIVEYFGHEILLPDGTLDRPKLGTVIFNDEKKRKKLNSIVHPAVRKAMVWEIIRCWVRGEKYCIMDVPLLIEVGLYKWVGRIVVVSCPEEVQLTRLMARDKSTEEAAKSRIKSQMPIAEKAGYADEVIDNSGTKSDLAAQVDALVSKLESKVRWTWRLEWLVPPFGIVMAVWTVVLRAVRRRARAYVSNTKKD